MPIFTMSTGNLPVALSATAVPFASRTDLKDKQPPEGFRFCFVGYKVSKEDAKNPTINLSQSFVVNVPIGVDAPEQAWNDFTAALAADYQDRLIHDVADKKSTVDPLDWSAIITDYFDTARNKNTISLAEVSQWVEDVWMPSYELRSEQLGTPKTAIAVIKAKYPLFFREIAKKTCGLSRENIDAVRRSTERLIELKFIAQDDDVALFIIERCNMHTGRTDEQLVADV